MKYTENPTFLGVTYDPQLTFGPHVSKVRQNMLNRGGVLSRLAGADWGWSRGSMRTVYQLATQRSVAEYATQPGPPWVSKSGRANVESGQNDLRQHLVHANAASAQGGWAANSSGEI